MVVHMAAWSLAASLHRPQTTYFQVFLSLTLKTLYQLNSDLNFFHPITPSFQLAKISLVCLFLSPDYDICSNDQVC